MAQEKPVVIVGAGLAGLVCARILHQNGVPVQIVEASDAVGGRLRTDSVDGFLLDRGFQVLLTAYPEARRCLDYTKLQLNHFLPGACIYTGTGLARVDDPLRNPMRALPTALSSIGTLGDKLALAMMIADVTLTPESVLWCRPETTMQAAFKQRGFTDGFIRQFMSPFLRGITLDPGLETSSRFLDFVMRMFAQGTAALPQGGIQAIATQMAERLPSNTVLLNSRVVSYRANGVQLESGRQMDARAVVIACDMPDDDDISTGALATVYNSVTCLYFALNKAPVQDKLLILNGSGRGLINNLCFPSQIQPNYAPQGQALCSVSILGQPGLADAELAEHVKRELTDWFGHEVMQWRFLKAYFIKHAVPQRLAGCNLAPADAAPVRNGMIYCGDTVNTPSLQGALASGRLAAQAVLSGGF